MKERYTSHELSRQLAEAGIAQNVHEYGGPQNMRCCHLPCWSRFEDEWVINPRGNVYTASPILRALDLMDVLEEIMREREDGAPLAEEFELWWQWSISKAGTRARAWSPGKAEGKVNRGTPVEAAGLVLLALLKERRP